MPSAGRGVSLDDVQVMGEWNFTLQSDTPLFWIKSGTLDRYLLKFRAKAHCSPATFGMVFHAEADGPGTDGVSFWCERTPARQDDPPKKRYVLAGDGLDSKPVVTRDYPDVDGDAVEDVEMLLQSYTGCIFLQNRKIQIKFRLKYQKGSLAFYNTTQNKSAPRDEVFFSNVTITALRRGPLEVQGVLARREKMVLGLGSRTETVEAAKQAVSLGVAQADLRASEEAAAANEDAAAEMAGGEFGQQPDITNIQGVGGSPIDFRATAPSFGGVGGGTALAPGQQTYVGAVARAAGRGAKGTILRQSASDSVLRKTGAMSATSTKGKGSTQLPLAANPHMREQDLVKDFSRRSIEENMCRDFITF